MICIARSLLSDTNLNRTTVNNLLFFLNHNVLINLISLNSTVVCNNMYTKHNFKDVLISLDLKNDLSINLYYFQLIKVMWHH